MEWMLNTEVFQLVQNIFGNCDIDLFASKDNHQLSKYVSYLPDKSSEAVDAFSISWTNLKSYIFCPFSVLTQVLCKIERDNAEAIVVAPIWPTQTWFPKLLHLICRDSYILPKRKDLLVLPKNPELQHPLQKMRLGAFYLSGNQLKTQKYQMKLSTLLMHLGETQLNNSIGIITKSGCNFAVKKQINPFKANINNVLSFLTDLFKSGLGYSNINTAMCALSSYFSLDNSVNISSNVLVKRFMKGVYTLRPALPKYNVTWDVNVVLTYLKGLSPLESLSLLQISQKLLMLLLLLSGQRGQTIHLMDIKNIFITEDNVQIVIGDLLKNSKPGKQLGELNFRHLLIKIFVL